jgi:hypothetical protein
MHTRIDAVDRYNPELGWLRRCCACKEPKPHKDFCKHRKDHKGIQRVCKECTKRRKRGKRCLPTLEQYKARYKKERNQVLTYSRAHYRTVRGRFLTLISASRVRSRKKGLEHDLDINWALAKWEQQKGCCLITGIQLEIDTPLRSSSKDLNPFSPSLDRIRCDGGYTKDNTRIVCVAVNLAMNRFGVEVFHKLLEGYANQRKV